MAEAKTYVVVAVDDITKKLGGPYVWDGETQWQPPELGRLVTEAEHLQAIGFTGQE